MIPSDVDLLAGQNGRGRVPPIVTTSWYDGNPKDLKVAGLLNARDLPGTFFIPLRGYLGTETLRNADLATLSAAGFEIGAHSVSHESLRRLSAEELNYEVSVCKHKLQEVVGREITMFCYPNGYYDRKVIAAVKRAGYTGARTVRMLSLTNEIEQFEMPITVQAFPHSPCAYLRNAGRAADLPLLWRYMTELSRYKNWVELGKHLFDEMLEHGGIWHLYGHSWELERYQLWDQLEEMLDYIAHRNGVTYATNGALLRILNEAGSSAQQCRGSERIGSPSTT
jgi:peptidoglycan-N-acetylglucosamine deacetylase